MKNFRHAFTMIELIFVIVIIGVLAAIAIPKLAATRDDAAVAAGVTSVKQAIQDMGTHCITKGEFGTWQEMTTLNLSNKKKQKRSRYVVDNLNCIVFIRNEPNSITVKVNNKGYKNSKICKAISDQLIKLNLAAKNKGITHTFCGPIVNEDE